MKNSSWYYFGMKEYYIRSQRSFLHCFLRRLLCSSLLRFLCSFLLRLLRQNFQSGRDFWNLKIAPKYNETRHYNKIFSCYKWVKFEVKNNVSLGWLNASMITINYYKSLFQMNRPPVGKLLFSWYIWYLILKTPGSWSSEQKS